MGCMARPETEKTEYLGKIGGAERLNNNTICFGLLGKDSGAEGRDSEFGHADQFHGLCYDINNNTVTILTIPRHLKLPEINGVSANGITWIDQSRVATEGYQQIDREVARDVFEDAFGVPFDGVFEIDMNGFTQVINTLFPKGIDITIEEGESFVPENEVIGKISGYKEGGYKPFEEGRTYTFHGDELLAFVRSRYTSKEGYFDREERASGTMTQLLQAMSEQLTHELKDPFKAPTAIANLIQITQTLESLEADGSMRMTWNLEFNDPDEAQAGQKSRMFSDFMQIALMSMMNPKNLGTLIRMAASGGVDRSLIPEFQRFQISPEAEEPALKVVPHPDSNNLIYPGKESTWYKPAQALKYFAQLREFMQGQIYRDESKTVGKTPPTETSPEETPPEKVIQGETIGSGSSSDIQVETNPTNPSQEQTNLNEPIVSPESVVAQEVRIPGPPRIMILGDSLVSGGMIPEYFHDYYENQGKEMEFVGSQSHFGESQVPHEGHSGFTTGAILRDLKDGTWNEVKGAENPVFDLFMFTPLEAKCPVLELRAILSPDGDVNF